MNPLPPGVEALTLPEAEHLYHDAVARKSELLFTADQLHAAHAAGARVGFLAGLEAGAKVCDRVASFRSSPLVDSVAEAIRQLKEQQ